MEMRRATAEDAMNGVSMITVGNGFGPGKYEELSPGRLSTK